MHCSRDILLHLQERVDRDGVDGLHVEALVFPLELLHDQHRVSTGERTFAVCRVQHPMWPPVEHQPQHAHRQ